MTKEIFMSCNHLCDCSRCGGQAERLTNALKKAVSVINNQNGEIDIDKLNELYEVIRNDGVDLED